MTTHSQQYSPLLQGDWSEEEEEAQDMLAPDEADPEGGKVKKGTLPFPQPYRHNRRVEKRVPPLHVFLAVVGVISAGLVIAIISGVIRSHIGSEPQYQQVGQMDSNMTSVAQKSTTIKPVTTTASKMVTTHKNVKIRPPNQEATTKQTHQDAKIQPQHQNVQSTGNWRVVLNDTGTESCVRTPDIDGDGLPDVLFGLAHGVDLIVVNALDEGNSLKKYCEEKHMPYPCIGFLLALRGIDGKELWRLPTRSEVMFMMCDLDLNGDGMKDCIATGRQSTIQAVDLKKGETLWYADGSEYPSHFKQMWNVYQAVPLPDVDGDGVADIVVAHGGDPNIDSQIHDRVAGRLIVLSGATGRPLGDYHDMPYSKETYMTPVLYTDTDGSQYLLFGSGGETVAGDLMVITLPDLFKATNQKVTPELRGEYRLKKLLYPHSGIMVLYKGKEKGVMVPPVIIDIDNDGVQDILMSAFDGHMVMYDGRTLETRWEKTFSGQESYSTPAPGYFDDDEYLDFMVHWSRGQWPSYNESTVLILSGKDGSILWKDRRPMFVMSSDLVLRSTEDRQDYFMVKMRGKDASIGIPLLTEAHGIGAQRNISKRGLPVMDPDEQTCTNLSAEFGLGHVTCDRDLTAMNELVYLLNRNNVKSSLPLMETEARKYRYDYQPKQDEVSCDPVNKDTGKVNICVVMLPSARSTDAVTDVDNDGRLDLINAALVEGRLRDSRYSYSSMKFTTIISRIDIEAAVQSKLTTDKRTDRMFAPLASQPWLQYLGSDTSSVYSQNIEP